MGNGQISFEKEGETRAISGIWLLHEARLALLQPRAWAASRISLHRYRGVFKTSFAFVAHQTLEWS